MKSTISKRLPLVLALLVAGVTPAWAQDSELDQLKSQMKAMEQTMEQMKQKIADLEKEKAAAPAAPATNAAAGSASVLSIEKVAGGGMIGNQTPVTDRGALNDQQEGAPRRKDYTLDPTYRGFIPVPNTPVLVKFNAKPRVDVTSDSRCHIR